MHQENKKTMKNLQKSLTDAEILQNVINAIGVRIPEFRVKLGFGTNTTIYNVLKGVNGISSDMINRILNKYPDVSYLYLKKGEGKPIRTGPAATNQKNILEDYSTKDFVSIQDFLKLPEIVEELKNRITILENKINQLKKATN